MSYLGGTTWEYGSISILLKNTLDNIFSLLKAKTNVFSKFIIDALFKINYDLGYLECIKIISYKNQ